MRIGVVFPQTELGGDASAVRAYGQRVEELGFDHLLAYDHVVGADPAVHVGWAGPYDVHTTFHDRNRHHAGIWFSGHRVGGALCAGDDAIDAAFFALDEMPTPLAFDTDARVINRL